MFETTNQIIIFQVKKCRLKAYPHHPTPIWMVSVIYFSMQPSKQGSRHLGTCFCIRPKSTRGNIHGDQNEKLTLSYPAHLPNCGLTCLTCLFPAYKS